jgi:hypothetical protein
MTKELMSAYAVAVYEFMYSFYGHYITTVRPSKFQQRNGILIDKTRLAGICPGFMVNTNPPKLAT